MRHLAMLAALLALAAGCGRKNPPEPAAAGDAEPAPAPVAPGDPVVQSRAHWLNGLKATSPKARQEASDELAAWVDTDPEAVAALLELLKDKTTAGTGKASPAQMTSTREAAAAALLNGGVKGQAALKEKGLAILKDGLADPQPAIREHTAFTLGQLGSLARPLSADVMKLCTSPEEAVRGAAFTALRQIGITDVAGLAALLTHPNRDVARLAAELVPLLPEVPDAAVPKFTAAVGSEDPSVQVAAAFALASAGPRAAAAAGPLAEAIKKTRAYQADYDPTRPHQPGPEMALWEALARTGEAAVAPATALLDHPNALVKGYAATALGEIGPPAKPAAGKLKELLKNPFGFVVVEAACALCRIGEGQAEAAEEVRRAIDAPNNVAQLAIEAVPRMGEAGKPLVPAALAKLTSDNPFARFGAVTLVASLPPAEAAKVAPEVGKLLTDLEKDIRVRAGAVLERLGPAGAAAADALGKALAAETDEGLRDQFVDALLAMGPGAKPAVPALVPLINSPALPVDRRARAIAAAVGGDPASKDVAAAVVTAAGNDDPSVRVVAALALGRLDPLPSEAVAKLVALANSDPRTPPRVAALKALAVAGPKAKGAKAEVEAIAAGPQAGLSLLAKVAAAAMDGNVSAAAPAVRAGLTAKSAQAREAAAEALVVIGPTPADLPALLRLLRDVNAPTREAAARCVGRLGAEAKEAVPQLVTLLDAREGEVRLAAVEALGEMGLAAKPAAGKLAELAGDAATGPAARRALEKIAAAEKK